jgi:hypothetical protein
MRGIKSGKMRWTQDAVNMAEMRNAYTVSVGKSEGKRPRDKWDNNSITDLNETEDSNVDLHGRIGVSHRIL